MHLPCGILSIDCTIVGAATRIVLIPATLDLLRVHALSLCTDRLDLEGLVTLYLHNTIQVTPSLIRTDHERVEVLWFEHLPHMARLRLVGFLSYW